MMPGNLETKVSVPINSELDIVRARQKAREMAAELGFVSIDLALISTSVSELARNIISYATAGTVILELIKDKGKRCIVVTAEDKGPGIENIELAMQDGYSTTNSLGLGLPGVRRMMDEFTINSALGEGTTICTKKWLIGYGPNANAN